MKRDVKRFVDGLVRQRQRRRRPRAFAPDDEDVELLRAAIALSAARPGAGEPREEFVDELRGRLAAGQEREPAALPRPRAVLTPRRRRLLQGAAVAASAFTAGVFVDRTVGAGASDDAGGTDAQAGADSGAGSAIVPSAGVWRTVVPAAELTEGTVRSFEAGALAGVVQRVSGRLRAVSSICTHQACRLGLNDARDTLVCPCHGATFSVQGAPRHNPRSSHPLPALPRLAVREFQGDIQVYCPAPADA